MIVVIGAGVGGLAAAAWLAKQGRRVLVLEARDGPGGLASGFSLEGLRFDGGPYVVLDRAGLEWVFHELGEDLSSRLRLLPIEELYDVEREDGPAIRIFGNLERTVREMDSGFPGAGSRYGDFVRNMTKIYERLSPLQYVSRPGPLKALASGAWRQAAFLFRSLAGILEKTGLPGPVRDAISIWTHVAGQAGIQAPSPMAFVPALVHTRGAFVPEGGMSRISEALADIARAAGVEFRFGSVVRRVTRDLRVECNGETIQARAVVSNAGGLSTYLELLEGTPARFRRELERLPLQTPGVCAYLSVTGPARPPFLNFRLPREGLCRLLITPGVADPSLSGTARLLGPVDFAWAEREGTAGQQAYVRRLLDEPWWHAKFETRRVLATRTPSEWGETFRLYRNSMNPVMTARFMRRGRMAHRSPVLPGLFLAGSSTHPGQWVSFCAISGILAAKEAACS